nr:immunoglobulin light chain junction region [Macaca mulatta]
CAAWDVSLSGYIF